MIPRAELEFTLAMAERGIRSETPPEVMAELCRVYLAWVDAPEGEVAEFRCGEFSQYGVRLRAMEQVMWNEGKRVKLVEVPDE